MEEEFYVAKQKKQENSPAEQPGYRTVGEATKLMEKFPCHPVPIYRPAATVTRKAIFAIQLMTVHVMHPKKRRRKISAANRAQIKPAARVPSVKFTPPHQP